MVDPKKVFSDLKVIALARAAAAGKLPELESILAGGANVKAIGKKGFTITHFALQAKTNVS